MSKYDLKGYLKYRYIYKYNKFDNQGNWLIQEYIREVCNIKNLASVKLNILWRN